MNLPIINDAVHGPSLFIDNSTLERLLCPREFEYGFVRSITTTGDKPALNFGSGIHAALAARYKEFGTGTADESRLSSVLSEHFVKNPQPEGEFRSLGVASGVLRGYLSAYPTEDFTIVSGPTGPHIEHSFAHFLEKVRGINIFYMGRVDMIVRDVTNNILILDHKTTSMYGDSFWDDMKMAAQFRGYAWAYKKQYGQCPFGYMIDAIRVRRPTKADNRDAEYTGSYSTRRDDFARDVFPLNDDNLDEWVQNTLAQLDEIMYFAERDYFPMRTKQCRHKYGVCQFFNVCSIPRASREAMLQSAEFTKNEWSPLNKPN